MRKPVSLTFAVIVIVFAIIVGAITFTLRLRSYDAARAREAEALQARAERMQRSGRRGRMGSRRVDSRSATSTRPGGAVPGRGAAPGASAPVTTPGGSSRPGAAPPAEKPAPATRQPGK